MAKTAAKPRKEKSEKDESNYYFNKTAQDAIVEYCNTDSRERQNYLYKTIIGPKLKELIDNVVQAYSLGGLPNISSLKEECLFYTITVLAKYDPNKKNKQGKTTSAFTYFTVVIKHHFFGVFKKNKKQKYVEISLDDLDKTGDQSSSNSSGRKSEAINEIVTYNEYERFLDNVEFKQELLNSLNIWQSWYKDQQRVCLVLEALSVLLSKADDIDFFNKKGLFVYLRELTGLETKDISASLKIINPLIKEFLSDWTNGLYE